MAALLSAVCQQMSVRKPDTAWLDNLNNLPQNWNDFQSMSTVQLQQCHSAILQQLNIDSETMHTIWFHMHYLALYEHFNVREGEPFDVNEDVFHAFAALISRHSSVVKHHTNEVRIEWTDIQQALKIRKSGRPQSPWGVIPSLSIPADPKPFVNHIWPQCPFASVQLPDAIRQVIRKQYGSKSTDVLIGIYLKTLDLAAIASYGLKRLDESDKRLIRHYQKYGNVFAIASHDHANKDLNHGKHCNLKLCVPYHRTCVLMHLHGRCAENILASEAQQSEQKQTDKEESKSNRLQKYVALYLGKEFDAETVWNDIRHIQQKHIDFWVKTDVNKLLSQRPKISYNDDDDGVEDAKSNESELFECMERYQDVKQFVLDMNETRDKFCGEFVCDILRSSDAEQSANDKVNHQQNNDPTFLPIISKTSDTNDLYELCVALHKNMFHGNSLCRLLEKYAVKAAKIDPERERKLRAAIRADIQSTLIRKFHAK
mmetsp:Transcript_13607/g.20536  ORF Transcript_13607/g.20536 Transcript_13607/m.20536 type:complete len:485 (+) Transcript_13607:39-1493(+)